MNKIRIQTHDLVETPGRATRIRLQSTSAEDSKTKDEETEDVELDWEDSEDEHVPINQRKRIRFPDNFSDQSQHDPKFDQLGKEVASSSASKHLKLLSVKDGSSSVTSEVVDLCDDSDPDEPNIAAKKKCADQLDHSKIIEDEEDVICLDSE